MQALCAFIIEQHRASLRGESEQRREGRPARPFTRPPIRHGRREPRRQKKGGNG